MTPKDKAKDLVEHYAEVIEPIHYGVLIERNWGNAKQCALIAVDEILKLDIPVMLGQDSTPYWQQVKTEIEAL